jgi:hypothetical protein
MKRLITLAVFIMLFLTWGCSSGGGNAIAPVAPVETERPVTGQGNSSHVTWGLYQFIADPVAQTLEATPLRAGNMHLNVLPFVEPPPLVFLTLETLEFNGNIIETDIGLRHPFLGLTEFTGFDVCGILISNGTVTGFQDSSLVHAGAPDDTYLMNPDGYSPWWNPLNFPNNPLASIFSYIDGLLGAPDDIANYNSTLCGYKYFADDLAPDDDLDMLTSENRGVFSPGQKNVRHYTIHIGDEGLVFNYAIDANWEFPNTNPPWEAPGSFAETANRPEAYRISVQEVENGLYYIDENTKGGTSTLNVIAYDWQGPDTIESVMIEGGDLWGWAEETSAFAVDDYSGTFQFEINGEDLVTSAPIDFFITVKDVDTHSVLGNICHYNYWGSLEVSSEDPVQYEETIFFYADHPGGRDIFSVDPLGAETPYQWTAWGGHWTEGPKISPDGRYVIYAHVDLGTFGGEIRRIDLETETDITLTGMAWAVYASWRNDGLKISYTYTSSLFGPPPELYTMDPDGTNQTPLPVTSLYPGAHDWSADDSEIIFMSFNTSQLHKMNVSTGALAQYTNNGTFNDDPDISPDGTMVAWATMYSTSCRNIYISPYSGNWYPPSYNINAFLCDRSPAFSLDGSKIAYDHGSGSVSAICTYDLATSVHVDITPTTMGAHQPDWGEVLVFD